jgi:hypothetical protein
VERPIEEVEEVFQDYLRLAEYRRGWGTQFRPGDSPTEQKIDSLKDVEKRAVAMLCIATLRAHPLILDDKPNSRSNRSERIIWSQRGHCDVLLTHLIRNVMGWNQHEIEQLCQWVTDATLRLMARVTPLMSDIRLCVRLVNDWVSKSSGGRPTPIMVEFLERALAVARAESRSDPVMIRRAKEMLGRGLELAIEPGEAWSDVAIHDVQSCVGERRTAWMALLEHCRNANGSSPNAKWTKGAKQLLEVIGEAEFAARLIEWFPLVDRPRTVEYVRPHEYARDMTNGILDAHMDILRGLCWLAPSANHPDLPRALGRLVISAYRKLPGLGPRAVRVGNGAVYALGACTGSNAGAALGQLSMLRVKVKFGGGQKAIEKALNAAAERAGLPRNEIDELGVPSYGLSDVGVREEDFGTHVARLTVTTGEPPELLFFKRGADGTLGAKGSKSVPAAVKESHAEDLKEFKAAAKDIAAMLPAQRERIDGLFLDDRTWAFGVWRERYLDHPLVGVVARRLIWRVRDGADAAWRSLAWLDGHGLVDVDGNPGSSIGSAAQVRLWHPIEVDVEEVLAWRRFYESRSVRQPFKQAHREVYVLTDAERRTANYSNRYAAHILKQHQFNTLCALRGWKNRLRLMVDDEYPAPSRTLGAWGIRAEFWIEGVGDDYGTDTNESGAFLYLATDQVRFYRAEAPAATAHAGGGPYEQRVLTDGDTPMRGEIGNPEYVAQPLETIPPLVFSEIMRDVDLFVGVCSIGNNAQWQDGGPENRFREYWWNYGFADLSASGEGRRDLLERLIPRLKIASKCSFEERFLVVKGQIRTYKIHLGSGNILMKPNDQYLCIVPDSRTSPGGNVHLPFEGDRMLSIILSKAFMLAEDEKITDESITRQIRG